MTQPNQPLTSTPESNLENQLETSSNEGNSMGEYYQLKKNLLVLTLILTGIIFIGVWLNYSLNIALNYLLGAVVGLLYLRRLSKDVEGLSSENPVVSKNRLIFFVGLIIIATQLNQLKVLPIFLGFLTYKAAIVIYMLQTSFIAPSK